MFTETAWHFDLALEKARDVAKSSGKVQYLVIVRGANKWRIFETIAPEQQRLPYFSVTPSGKITPHTAVASTRR